MMSENAGFFKKYLSNQCLVFYGMLYACCWVRADPDRLLAGSEWMICLAVELGLIERYPKLAPYK